MMISSIYCPQSALGYVYDVIKEIHLTSHPLSHSAQTQSGSRPLKGLKRYTYIGFYKNKRDIRINLHRYTISLLPTTRPFLNPSHAVSFYIEGGVGFMRLPANGTVLHPPRLELECNRSIAATLLLQRCW